MNSRLHKNFARALGAILGAGLALAFLIAARPGANGAPLPATVQVAFAPIGELEVTPASPRPVFRADSLTPGHSPSVGAFQVRNQTGSPLAIKLETTADSTALDGLVRLRLSADGKQLADTTLQGMRQRSVGLELASGAVSRLRLQASIPSDVLTGYEGRRVEVSLVPSVQIAGDRK
jgi:hypothetical protein